MIIILRDVDGKIESRKLFYYYTIHNSSFRGVYKRAYIHVCSAEHLHYTLVHIVSYNIKCNATYIHSIMSHKITFAYFFKAFIVSLLYWHPLCSKWWENCFSFWGIFRDGCSCFPSHSFSPVSWCHTFSESSIHFIFYKN